MQKKLTDYNNKPFQKVPGSRSSVFLAEEKQTKATYWQSERAGMSRKIIKIEAMPKIFEANTPNAYRRRVAAYARVSTSSDEQLLGIEA